MKHYRIVRSIVRDETYYVHANSHEEAEAAVISQEDVMPDAIETHRAETTESGEIA